MKLNRVNKSSWKLDGFLMENIDYLRQRRILCAESHPDTLELLVYLLESSGYSVIPCQTILSSLESIDNYCFDLYLITDYLEDGSGVELLKRLRLIDKETPVVFFSTLTSPNYLEGCNCSDFQAFLNKPADINEIVDTINRVIEKFSPSASTSLSQNNKLSRAMPDNKISN